MSITHSHQNTREEEAYRNQVRAKLEEKPVKEERKMFGVSPGTALAIVIIVLFLLTYKILNPTARLNETKTREVADQIKEETGRYESYTGKTYNYEILYEQDNSQYVATFSPFLPNNDKDLLEGIFMVLRKTYGSKAQIVPTPNIEARENGNVIRFASDIGNYYVFPIKEDTGEIHTLIYWKE